MGVPRVQDLSLIWKGEAHRIVSCELGSGSGGGGRRNRLLRSGLAGHLDWDFGEAELNKVAAGHRPASARDLARTLNHKYA
jgi:hypothetical protein